MGRSHPSAIRTAQEHGQAIRHHHRAHRAARGASRRRRQWAQCRGVALAAAAAPCRAPGSSTRASYPAPGPARPGCGPRLARHRPHASPGSGCRRAATTRPPRAWCTPRARQQVRASRAPTSRGGKCGQGHCLRRRSPGRPKAEPAERRARPCRLQTPPWCGAGRSDRCQSVCR